MAASPGECGNAVDESGEDLSEEECSYILRVLEKDAFAAVVSAFRAQGMLTLYKQELLRHLKEALFITESTYHGEMERVANDEYLSKVASTLNPSYDTYAEWEFESEDKHQHAMNNMQIPIYDSDDLGGMELADELLRLANSHNEKLNDCTKSLCRLIKLPVAPYVPERMRVLLRHSEIAAASCLPLRGLPNAAEGANVPHASSAIKEESLTERERPLEEEPDSKIRRTPTPAKRPPKVQSLFLRVRSDGRLETVDPATSTSATAARSGNVAASSSTDSSLSASVASVEKLGSSCIAPCTSRRASFSTSQIGDEDTTERNVQTDQVRTSRKRKHHPDTQMCARVKPFIFDPQLPGCPKPIRGSPDRRLSVDNSTATVCQLHAAVSPLPSVSLAMPSTSNTSYNSPVVAFSTTLPSCSRSFVTTTSPTVVTGRIISPSSHFPAGLVIKRGRALSISGDANAQSELNSAHTRNPTVKQSLSRPGITPNYYSVAQPAPGPSRSAQASSTTAIPIATPSALGNQYILASDVQRFVAQANSGGQLQRTLRRSSFPRPTYVTSGPPSTVALRNLQPVTILGRSVLRQNAAIETKMTANGSAPTILSQNPSLGMNAQLLQPATFRLPQGSLTRGSPAFYTAAPTDTPTTLSPMISRADETQQISPRQMNDDGTAAAINSATPESDKPQCSSSMDRFNGDEGVLCKSTETLCDGIRLQCDEVMLPEQRCLLATLEDTQSVHFSANSGIISRQNATGKVLENAEEIQGGSRSHRLLQTQYQNGLTHQEGQNVISYVTAPQCIR